MTTIVRVSAGSSRAEIAEAISALKAKHDRMPRHWVDRRQVVMDEIDGLVESWIEAAG